MLIETLKKVRYEVKHVSARYEGDGDPGCEGRCPACLVEAAQKEASELVRERDEWKHRAAQHGCNVETGDSECG